MADAFSSSSWRILRTVRLCRSLSRLTRMGFLSESRVQRIGAVRLTSAAYRIWRSGFSDRDRPVGHFKVTHSYQVPLVGVAPLRPEVPERHIDLRAVQFAAHGCELQGRDVPAGAAEDVAQRLFGHRRSPVLAHRVGWRSTIFNKGGARPRGPVHRGDVTTLPSSSREWNRPLSISESNASV